MEETTIFDSDRAEYEYAKQIEKQAIEEMAKVIERTEQIARDAHCGLPSPTMYMYAKDLYWHGYRKQSEGEWKPIVKCKTSTKTLIYYQCSLCGVYLARKANFCPNCGAHMKGGAE